MATLVVLRQTKLVQNAALLVQLQSEVEQFGRLAAASLPDSAPEPVPACAGMDLGELVRHVGSVHRVGA